MPKEEFLKPLAALYEEGRYGEVITAIEALPEADRSGEALTLLVKAYGKAGRGAEAEALLRSLKGEGRDGGFIPAVMAEHMDEIDSHMEKCFPGRATVVFHELVSERIHLDVFVMKASKKENFHVLYTVGMSALPMTLEGVAEEYIPTLRFAELMIFLPAHWDMETLSGANTPEEVYWPVRLLKTLARYPHECGTWLGHGHSIVGSEDYEPFASNTGFCGSMLAALDESISEIQLKNGQEVNMYMVVPLYKEEIEKKIKTDAETILEKLFALGAENPWVVDIKRKNTARSFWH